MGNSGDALFLPQLEKWSAGDDEVLAESARWATSRIRKMAANNRDAIAVS
jgi:epoxyqueuosine reductase